MFNRFFRITWTPKRLQQWEKTRSKGKRHFVFLRGALLFGSFMFVFMQLWQFIYWYYIRHNAPPSVEIYAVVSAIVYPTVGWLLFDALWVKTEQSYQEYRQAQDRKTSTGQTQQTLS